MICPLHGLTATERSAYDRLAAAHPAAAARDPRRLARLACAIALIDARRAGDPMLAARMAGTLASLAKRLRIPSTALPVAEPM